MQICSNVNILRNGIYWGVCENWDHQILRTQVRTFEPKILYKNKKKEKFNTLLPGGNKKVTHTCFFMCV